MSTPPPFGIILPSRPVLTNATTISPTQYAFTFPSNPTFSHIVVFLLPGAALPPGTLTGVYIQLPTSPEFKFLGAIGIEKPSAIFRINNHNIISHATANGPLNHDNDGGEAMQDTMTDPPSSVNSKDITLGLSIEPAPAITAQLSNLQNLNPHSSSHPLPSSSHHPPLHFPQPPAPAPHQTKLLAQRIIKNAYNFLGSFAGTKGGGGEEVVPLKSFQEWWMKFERRVELDPGFLEREE